MNSPTTTLESVPDIHLEGIENMLDEMFLFVDRTEAGESLAAQLLNEPLVQAASPDDLLVLSIPRGGVVVGAAIARGLNCAHDVVVVKKIGFPGQEELAIGAMAEDGTVVLNKQVTVWSELKDDYVKQKEACVKAKIDTYISKFRWGRALNLRGKTVIVADDGIATGETMKAAINWMTSKAPSERPANVIVAVPVCSPLALNECAKLADRLVCLYVPRRFWAVGQFYWNFDQVSDEEVIRCLAYRQEPRTT